MRKPGVIPSNWRAIATAASVLAAMAFAAAMAGRGCRDDTTGPTGVVRQMVTAARAGDRAAVYKLLSPDTQQRLQVSSQRATDLAGSADRYHPFDLISIGRIDEGTGPKDYKLVEKSESSALVEVVSHSGLRARIRVVNVDGKWRVDLPDYASDP
jgi:hypothetical protein